MLMKRQTTCVVYNSAELLSTVDVVAIDEGQFFADLTDYCELWANQGKICIVSALDGTFERKPFPSVIGLISLAEEVMKLSGITLVVAITHLSSEMTYMEHVGVGGSSFVL
jgi:thymidine kinase